MRVSLPLWLEDESIPQYVRDAGREAAEDIFNVSEVPKDVIEAVAGLRSCCVLWSWQYYNGESSVSDNVYDAAFKYITVREQRYPQLITPLSPTQRVGKVMEDKPKTEAEQIEEDWS